MQIAVLGIDLGKTSCSVVGLDAGGSVILRRRLPRTGVIKLAAGLPSCVIAMEACCGAHHLGRLLQQQGHASVSCHRSTFALTSKRKRTTTEMPKQSQRPPRVQQCGSSN